MEKIAEFSSRLLEALSGSMTATQLAEKLGMSKQTISAYTTGTRSPKRPVVYVMAEILHVNPLWLLDYDVSKYDIPPKKGGIKNPPADCNRQGSYVPSCDIFKVFLAVLFPELIDLLC